MPQWLYTRWLIFSKSVSRSSSIMQRYNDPGAPFRASRLLSLEILEAAFLEGDHLFGLGGLAAAGRNGGFCTGSLQPLDERGLPDGSGFLHRLLAGAL